MKSMKRIVCMMMLLMAAMMTPVSAASPYIEKDGTAFAPVGYTEVREKFDINGKAGKDSSEKVVIKIKPIKGKKAYKINGKTYTFSVKNVRTDKRLGNKSHSFCKVTYIPHETNTITTMHGEKLVYSFPRIPGYKIIYRSSCKDSKPMAKTSVKKLNNVRLKGVAFKKAEVAISDATIKKTGNDKKFIVTITNKVTLNEQWDNYRILKKGTAGKANWNLEETAGKRWYSTLVTTTLTYEKVR